MRRALPVLAALAALVGCGGSPGNTIELTMTGLGPKRTLLVTENGQGSCDGGTLRDVPSADVLQARVVARSLKKEIQSGNDYRATASQRGPGRTHRTFTARTLDGTVQWSELYKPLPPELSQAELLALRLQGELCS